MLMFAWIAFSVYEVQAKEILIIKGDITYEHEKSVREHKETLKYLVLDTKGGNMQFAYSIMTIISYYNIITIIPPGKSCESACTIIFQAGKQRHAGKESTLVYHAAHFGDKVMHDFIRGCPQSLPPNAGCVLVFNQMKTDLVKETIKMFLTLEHFGLDNEVFGRLRTAPMVFGSWMHNGNLLRLPDFVYTAEEAMRLNAVTDIVEWDTTTTLE